MLAGAAVVSDESEYLKEHFINGKELKMFSLQNVGRLAQTVQDLLIHTDKAQSMADCGYQTAIQSHQWINRLRDLDLIL